MIEYTLGVATNDIDVVLIRKKRPAWQARLNNFVGGKLEPGERPLDGMVREFEEETGVHIPPEEWKYVGKMSRVEDFVCHIFSYDGELINDVASMTDEDVFVGDYRELIDTYDPKVVSNVPFIFKFVQSPDFREQGANFEIVYP